MSSFLLDLHCHTLDHSYDGQISASEICRTLLAKGFHGLVLTDHNYVWPAEELEELHEEAGLPESFLLLSGQEVRTASDGIVTGDLLLFGLPFSLPDDICPKEVFQLVKDHNGFAIAPHPGVPRIGFGDELGNYPVIAGESWNGRYGKEVARRSRLLLDAHGLAEFGGSDAHRREEIGGGGTLFPLMPRHLGDIEQMLHDGMTEAWAPSSVDRMKRWLRRRIPI